MKSKITLGCIAVLCSFMLTSFIFISQSQNVENANIYGLWWNAEKTAKIKIYKAKSGKACGKITWLKEPNNENGKPKVDKENPNKELAKKPIINLVVLKHLVYKGNNKWEDGKIYDPNNGKDYSCEATLSADNKTLDLRGYVGFSLLGRTSSWKKVN